MRGVRIDVPVGGRKFTSVFGSMLDAFSRQYWFIDGYGPFSTTDKANFRELDTELERYSVGVQGIDYGPPGLWKPGILPWAAELLVVDEGTTLVGSLGDETKAKALAAALDRELSYYSAKFFALIQREADVALLHIDGWGEIHSSDPELMRRLRQIKGAQETDSYQLCRRMNSYRRSVYAS